MRRGLARVHVRDIWLRSRDCAMYGIIVHFAYFVNERPQGSDCQFAINAYRMRLGRHQFQNDVGVEDDQSNCGGSPTAAAKCVSSSTPPSGAKRLRIASAKLISGPF